MNLKPYVAKQELLDQYRNNLHNIEVTIASYGGLIHAPLSIQNQYDGTKKNIEILEKDIQNIELQMIKEMPIIREAFEEMKNTIKKRDVIIDDLTWKPINRMALTQDEITHAYVEISSYIARLNSYKNNLVKDQIKDRSASDKDIGIILDKLMIDIIEAHDDLINTLKRYYH